ncbi:MAG: hypothetical protein ABIJ45_02820 [Candidatus Zixiibacteriota bacterium]
MTSQKKVESNRKNAQKSTGPKTEEGKDAVRMNAFKHGLFAKDIVINCPKYQENPAEFEELHQSLKDEFCPVGRFQEHLIYSIAISIWRFRRSVIAETAHISNQIGYVDTEQNYDDLLESLEKSELSVSERNDLMKIVNRIGTRVIPDDYFMLSLMRYQLRIDRQLRQNFKILKMMQLDDDAIELANFRAGASD